MAKICMVAFTNYSRDNRVRREAEALVERGDEVDCICLREQDREAIETLSGVRVLRLSMQKYQGSSSLLYLLTYALFFFLTFWKLTFLHLKTRYHIVHVHTIPDFLVFTALIPKILGAKVILDMHDLMPDFYMSKFGVDETSLPITIISWMERWSVAFADKAIAVHSQDLGLLVKRGNPQEKFITLLNVPDERIFTRCRESHESFKNGHFRLMYHGTVAERTGLDIALRSLVYARKEIPGLEFCILGEGDGLPQTKQLAEELQLNGCVKFMKTVPLEQLPPLITQADAGILPYRNDQYTRYLLPVKLLEYVALGVPVISSRLETIEAYFDDQMLSYFSPSNEVELAEKIVDLYLHPCKRKALTKSANRFHELYNWGTHKHVYFNLIDSLLPG